MPRCNYLTFLRAPATHVQYTPSNRVPIKFNEQMPDITHTLNRNFFFSVSLSPVVSFSHLKIIQMLD